MKNIQQTTDNSCRSNLVVKVINIDQVADVKAGSTHLEELPPLQYAGAAAGLLPLLLLQDSKNVSVVVHQEGAHHLLKQASLQLISPKDDFEVGRFPSHVYFPVPPSSTLPSRHPELSLSSNEVKHCLLSLHGLPQSQTPHLGGHKHFGHFLNWVLFSFQITVYC